MKTLRDVKIGESATVKRLHGEGATKRRIMDMGITKGTEIKVRKENVVTTFGVLFHVAGEVAEDTPALLTAVAAHYSAISAYSFMIFNLLCAPCFAAMGAIRREMNNAKWTWAAIGYMCVFAYAVSLIVYQFGSWSVGAGSVIGTFCAVLVLAFIVYMLLRPCKESEALKAAAACAN